MRLAEEAKQRFLKSKEEGEYQARNEARKAQEVCPKPDTLPFLTLHAHWSLCTLLAVRAPPAVAPLPSSHSVIPLDNAQVVRLAEEALQSARESSEEVQKRGKLGSNHARSSLEPAIAVAHDKACRGLVDLCDMAYTMADLMDDIVSANLHVEVRADTARLKTAIDVINKAFDGDSKARVTDVNDMVAKFGDILSAVSLSVKQEKTYTFEAER